MVVLVGDPVAHSLSPAIHNAAFAALGLDLAYLAHRVEARDLPAAVEGLHAMGAIGVNVTLPHKRAAWSLVNRRTAVAEATGSVNTLVREDKGWLGANTDVEGFSRPLVEAGVTGHHFVVLGAGGAARTAVYALLDLFAPERLAVAARGVDRARELVADLRPVDPAGALQALDLAQAGRDVRRADLIVNATSVGMAPAARESPWPDDTDFRSGQLVYDLVYTPSPTRLLRDAAARGARTLDGREMLLGQAAASFLLWTGREMPWTVARNALDNALRTSSA